MTEAEKEIEIYHECPKCGYKWTTVEIVIVFVDDEEPLRNEGYD